MEPRNHTHLSLDERRQIYFMLGRKMSAVKIAYELCAITCSIRNLVWKPIFVIRKRRGKKVLSNVTTTVSGVSCLVKWI